MRENRIRRLVDVYFNRPQKEYLFALNSIKNQGGLSEEEIKFIESLLPHVHASAIIRQATLVSAKAVSG
jgi:hypothetical protein